MKHASPSFIVILLFSAFTLSSCERCKSCECSGNGVTIEVEECASGLYPSRDLENWQRGLMIENDFDECFCVEGPAVLF